MVLLAGKRSKYSRCYDRVALQEIEPFFDIVRAGDRTWDHPEHGRIKLGSKRYQVFMQSTTCSECGIQARYFAIEKFPDHQRYHLNLYAVDDEGFEVLMTRDHIVARANGGPDTLENQQTMCTICNVAKGDK